MDPMPPVALFAAIFLGIQAFRRRAPYWLINLVVLLALASVALSF